ncbi:MAG: ROK family protein [Bacteroidales bacterium]|nr:ROK family protein [Bacteroidales bacterium]
MTLGIDIGGTNLCFGLVEAGKVVQGFSVPSFTPGATLEETLDYLTSQIRRIFRPGVERIGIGVPTVVDVKRGIVYDAMNIPSWKEVPLKEYLEARFGVPVSVNNDANCFAMGVYGTYPAEDRPEVLVAIALGTGLGIGIVNEGRLFCGAHCGAGELCSLPYGDSIIEDYTSKKFLTDAGWDSKEAARAAREGNPEALALFEAFGRHLGALLCMVMFTYDPDRIALAGGIANNHPFFRASMEEYLQAHFPYRKALERLRIDIRTDNDLPVIGASMI